jgi:hypothetical protein
MKSGSIALRARGTGMTRMDPAKLDSVTFPPLNNWTQTI